MALPRSFWLLWCGQTFSRVGILAPAFLVLYLEGNRLTDVNLTPVIVGLFGAGVVAAGLVGGVVADIIGARRTIILAQPAAVITALLFIVVTDTYALSGLSLVAGFLSMVDRPAGAGLIASLVPRDQFARAYSMLLVGFNIGMSLGPIAAGFLLETYPPGLFLLWAGCSLLYIALVWGLPKDRPSRTGEPEESTVLRRAVLGLVEPFRDRVMVLFLLLCFLIASIYLQLNSALPLDMRAEGLSPTQIGIVLATNAVLSVALLPLVPKVVGELRATTPLIMASALITLGFGMNAIADGMGLYVVTTVVWTLGEVLWAPMSATFLAKRAPAGRTSSYQGSFFFAWNAALVVGGPIGLTVGRGVGFGWLWIGTLGLGTLVTIGFLGLARAAARSPAPDFDGEAVTATAPALGARTDPTETTTMT